jgi:hypothetical protein
LQAPKEEASHFYCESNVKHSRRFARAPQVDIPIIGMSAHAVEASAEGHRQGCDEFDAKPIEFESLVATIRRMLAPHK